MSNKLRELFSDTEEIVTGTIKFPNIEAASAFNEILEKVYKDGSTDTIDDVATVEMNFKEGGNVYPLFPPEKPEKMVIGPSVKIIKLPVDVDGETREFELYSIDVKDGVKAHTKKDAVVEFDIFFSKDQMNNKLTFKTHPIKASNFGDIVESYELARGFLSALLVNHSEEYEEAQVFFKQNILFFKRLISVQDVLGTSFAVEDVVNNKEQDYIINKLFYLLCDRKTIRTEPSFSEKQKASICFENNNTVPEDISVGSNLFAYYISDQELHLYGKAIKIYTVNWLFNAVVDTIEKDEDNISSLSLRDNDSNPIYLSYSAFVTEEEAYNEIETIMNRKEEYLNAITFSEMLEQDLEKMKSSL